MLHQAKYVQGTQGPSMREQRRYAVMKRSTRRSNRSFNKQRNYFGKNKVNNTSLACFKFDSAVHPSEVDKMSTKDFWKLSGKK